MTTAPSSRSKFVVSLSVALAVAAGARASAHRLDEYLQAARIGIDPARVTIELDLTPGIAVASRVVAEIDSNRDGVISPDETRVYAKRVLQDIRVELDDRVLVLALIDTESATPAALRAGDGAIRFRATAAVPMSASGDHRLRFRNAHHADTGAYLANALVPTSARVGIVSQDRDVDQRELVVRYTLADDSSRVSWRPAAIGLGLSSIIGLAWWRSRVYWLDA